MRLDPQGREYYKPGIITTPVVSPTAWEASFDNGATWVSAVNVGGASAWLVAGPSATVGSAVAVITASLHPKIRLTDSPEIVVRRAPGIYLEPATQ